MLVRKTDEEITKIFAERKKKFNPKISVILLVIVFLTLFIIDGFFDTPFSNAQGLNLEHFLKSLIVSTIIAIIFYSFFILAGYWGEEKYAFKVCVNCLKSHKKSDKFCSFCGGQLEPSYYYDLK